MCKCGQYSTAMDGGRVLNRDQISRNHTLQTQKNFLPVSTGEHRTHLTFYMLARKRLQMIILLSQDQRVEGFSAVNSNKMGFGKPHSPGHKATLGSFCLPLWSLVL